MRSCTRAGCGETGGGQKENIVSPLTVGLNGFVWTIHHDGQLPSSECKTVSLINVFGELAAVINLQLAAFCGRMQRKRQFVVESQ